ncbi:MAG: zf-HC2 domain-containing protein [Gemmatimonadales bacterium]
MTSEPRVIDCQEAARRLHELIDGELTPEVERLVQRHLEDCAPCMAVYEFEEAFCRFVSLKAKSQATPGDLKKRILASLDLTSDSHSE